MSRNGSGTMTVPNTMVPGTPITASDHNENYTDIAAELTNSVAVDGQSTMTGALKAASGTVALPGITFGADTDSGLYRIGANNIGAAVNGAKVLDIATTGLTVTGDVDATTVKQGTFALVPAGVIWPYGGTTAPDGFHLCYGQSLLRADEPALFTAIGTTYGAADGTHFSLPDLRGRVPAGKDDMGGSSANRLTDANDGLDGDTLGDTGGGETQTLATANLPAYTPAGSVSNGTITLSGNVASAELGGSADRVAVGGAPGGAWAGQLGVSQATSSFTGTAQGGTSTAFGVVQPTIILNYIIKT